jgi:hypothetical protein
VGSSAFRACYGSVANAAVYDCTGGTGDVSITVERQGVLSVANSECSVTLVYVRAARAFTAFKGVAGPSSDVDLCGDGATISTGILQLAPRVEMILHGGESEGRYACTLTR